MTDIGYPDITPLETGAISADVAKRITEAFANDPTGRDALPIIQQAMYEFEATHVVIALGSLLGLIVRATGTVFPGGAPALLAVIEATFTHEEIPPC